MKWTLGNGSGTKRWVEMQKKRVPDAMRIFMVEFYRQVSISTPVDTGRARWGWNCSIAEKNNSVPPEGKYRIDLSRAKDIFTSASVTGKDVLYIQNAIPYIGALNNGWSKQAPARFVELAFANTVEKLSILIKENGWD